MAVDFTGDKEIYDVIRAGLAGLDIGILVNNVGVSYNHPEYFTDVEEGEDFHYNLIRTNVISTTMMSYIVLPRMVEKDRGLVINMASVAGVMTGTLLSSYSASKVNPH